MKLRITVQNVAYEVDVEVLDESGAAPVAAAPSVTRAPAAAPPSRPAAPAPAAGGAGGKTCPAPIAGTVVAIKCKIGDAVAVNQVLLTMEAMKMETNIASPIAGKIRTIKVNAGQAVKAGETLVEFE